MFLQLLVVIKNITSWNNKVNLTIEPFQNSIFGWHKYSFTFQFRSFEMQIYLDEFVVWSFESSSLDRSVCSLWHTTWSSGLRRWPNDRHFPFQVLSSSLLYETKFARIDAKYPRSKSCLVCNNKNYFIYTCKLNLRDLILANKHSIDVQLKHFGCIEM